MDTVVSQLFWELADLPASDRDPILVERQIPVDVCAEVQLLLQHDVNQCGLTGVLTQVSRDLSQAIPQSLSPPAKQCRPSWLRTIGACGLRRAIPDPGQILDCRLERPASARNAFYGDPLVQPIEWREQFNFLQVLFCSEGP